MEYIPFDAVFHALSESKIKKNGTQLSWTIFSQNTAGKFDFFIGSSSVYSFSLASRGFQKDAIYTVR